MELKFYIYIVSPLFVLVQYMQGKKQKNLGLLIKAVFVTPFS